MKKLKVVVGLVTQDNDYQREQASVAEATARRLGMELQVFFADGDAIAQTQQLLGVLHAPATERPDAVIVEPVGTGMPQVAKVAVQNGVGWIVLKRDPDYVAELRQQGTVPVGSLNCDNLEVGRIQGRQFGALLPAGGVVWYIEGPATDVSKQRRAGMEQTLPAGIEIRAARGKWTEESGMQAMTSRLQMQPGARPSVGLIGCQNDAMAMGARKAVEALTPFQHREEWLALPFTGVDGVGDGGQLWVQKRLLAATVVTPALTGLAMELLAQAMASGQQMPERTFTKPASYPSLEQLSAAAAPGMAG